MKKQWKYKIYAAVIAAGLSLQMPFAAMADMGVAGTGIIKHGWVNEELGPGAATWVDENGNVTNPPSKNQSQAEIISGGPGENMTAGNQAAENQVAADQQAEAARQAEAERQAAEQKAAAESQAAEAARQAEAEKAASGKRNIDPSKPMIALTFDDGPYAPVGNQIMDCLAKYGGKATFFVVGNRAHSYKKELNRMVAEGHEIGNHTYEHKYLTKLSAAQIQEQINKCNDAVEAACGVRPKLVRLPGGLKNQRVLDNVHAPMIMWNIDTMDWKTRNASKTINAVIGKVHDGDIVLMHEIYKQSGAAAVDIIPKLVAQGYQLVTVSEMAEYRGGVKKGGVYNKFRP